MADGVARAARYTREPATPREGGQPAPDATRPRQDPS